MSENAILFLASIGLALLGWAILLLLKVNNKVSCFNQWMESHEEIDKDRHNENLGKFKDIFEELRQIRRYQFRDRGGN